MYFLHGLSNLAKSYIIQGIKISGLPHLSLFTVPNNQIKETNQNEPMRCVACLGLFLGPPLLSTAGAQHLSAGGRLSSNGLAPNSPATSAHSTLYFKGNQMAGLGRGPLKEKQGVQAKKINTEEKERKAAAGGKMWAVG